jgi:hypothetical protein
MPACARAPQGSAYTRLEADRGRTLAAISLR